MHRVVSGSGLEQMHGLQSHRTNHRLVAAIAAVLVGGCVPTPVAAAAPALKPLANKKAMTADYRNFLDEGRTPSHIIKQVIDRGGWTVVDATVPPSEKIVPGQRLAFIDRNRTIMFVVVGRQPIASAGFRLIGAHIDTPAPRLDTAGLSRASQANLKTRRYGGTKSFHWEHRALAIVGTIAMGDGRELLVDLGLNDDFAFWAKLNPKGTLVVTTGSTPTTQKSGFPSLVSELAKRYQVNANDLDTAELYVVPRERARLVGLDSAFVGAHGQDDRSNSYVAWRALSDLVETPEVTAIAWLVDREEIGSSGTTGAQSRFLELVTSWLVRGQGERATEAVVHRLMARSEIISSDTPACLNPNWPEAHESQNVPLAGSGPAVFPYTGRRGKVGGSSASAEFIGKLRATFKRAKMPLQFGLLGHVDRGGGGTIAKYLAHRGASVLDIGVCVISMHSPLELVATDDLWSLYVGLKSWFGEKPQARN